MKRRFAAIILAVLLAAGMVPLTAYADGVQEIPYIIGGVGVPSDAEMKAKEFMETLDGEGTEESPYLLRSSEKLAMFVNRGWGFEGVYFKLTNDVNEHGTPIGTEISPFNGHFDGDGHTVVLDIESDSLDAGLFGYIGSCGVVCNVNTAGTVRSSAGVRFGGVCATNEGIILNCTNNAAIIPIGTNAAKAYAGVCGNLFYGVVQNCTNNSDISGENSANHFGGICGEGGGLILNCTNNGDITGKCASQFGGISGLASEQAILNCVNNGAVTGTGSKVGGVFGYGEGGLLLNCVNCGTVTCSGSDVGGVYGYEKNGWILNCFYDNTKTNTGEDKYSTGLPSELMTAKSGTDGALIDRLNNYYADNKETVAECYNAWLNNLRLISFNEYAGSILENDSVFLEWTTNGNGYPQLDYSGIMLTGSVLSTGDLWIDIVIAGAAIAAVAVLAAVKKKKSALAKDTANKEEE